MNLEHTYENAAWYAIRTHPNQEDRANNNLVAWNVETFNPHVRKVHHNPYASAQTYLSKPLFPRYIFARFEVNSMLHKILYTRGVSSVVAFGGVFAPINDEIISLIQSQVCETGFVEVGEKFKAGDRVMIEDGPLKSIVGIFKRDIKASDRVLILLAAINYQGSVVIERQHVRKIDTHEVSVQ
jgi:transcriptional antiterminator RfaH